LTHQYTSQTTGMVPLSGTSCSSVTTADHNAAPVTYAPTSRRRQEAAAVVV
jgi:hypothetical protein